MEASNSEIELLVQESISEIESVSELVKFNEPVIVSDEKEITEEAQEPNWVSQFRKGSPKAQN